MPLFEKSKRILIAFLFFVAIIALIQLYTISKKPSMAWITADRYTISSREPVNVSLEEIKEFTALLNALENAEKHGHYTDAFSLNTSDADRLLDIIKSKSSYEVKPYVRNRNKILYHFLLG